MKNSLTDCNMQRLNQKLNGLPVIVPGGQRPRHAGVCHPWDGKWSYRASKMGRASQSKPDIRSRGKQRSEADENPLGNICCSCRHIPTCLASWDDKDITMSQGVNSATQEKQQQQTTSTAVVDHVPRVTWAVLTPAACINASKGHLG